MEAIRYRETTEPTGEDSRQEGLALRIDPSHSVTLRFSLTLSESRDLEALRYARRAMIREERTRGLQWNEPSLEDPVITSREILWTISAPDVAWSREKIRELIERANRACRELRASERSEL